MNKSFIALLLFLSVSARAEVRELTRAAGPLVSVTKKVAAISVEYCPDNTCEAFTLRGRSPEVLLDFALAYLFGVSNYADLTEFQARSDLPEVAALTVRYGAWCPQPSQRSAARCIAARLARMHPIKASFVRYDEGRKHMTPIALEKL